MPIEITEAMKRDYNEKGFFILENVFTPSEMDTVAKRIEDFAELHNQRLVEKGTEGISRANEIAFTDHLAEKDEEIKAFVTRPEFVQISTAILGENVDLYWNQSVFKGPEGAKQFPWHQDDGYTPVTPSPYLTLWLALNDATTQNGCISVLPGSHKEGLVTHWRSEEGLVCHALDDPDQGVQVPIKAGSLIAFQSLTMHKSGINVSQGYRKAYVIQYSKSGLRHKVSGELITKTPIIVSRSSTALKPGLKLN
ncbi:MAG: phytanoyl-CoA dioxygenase family protein [Chthonomonadaceae bacterium]|nr:phytanoyl-CoA dioxygenase family protein [Chthonomonadaceae bacterium]